MCLLTSKRIEQKLWKRKKIKRYTNHCFHCDTTTYIIVLHYGKVSVYSRWPGCMNIRALASQNFYVFSINKAGFITEIKRHYIKHNSLTKYSRACYRCRKDPGRIRDPDPFHHIVFHDPQDLHHASGPKCPVPRTKEEGGQGLERKSHVSNTQLSEKSAGVACFP